MFVERSQQELARDFRDTFLRLVRAGEAFDEGHEYEAASIAALIYVLVHEGGKRSPSLLTMLGRKTSLKFVDSAAPLNPRNLLTETPLVMMEVSNNGFRYKARRDTGPFEFIPCPFSKWWEKPVLRDPQRRVFSRKNLIHFFRHFRGGGHVGRRHEPQDTLPAQAFADMASRDPGNWFYNNGTKNLVPEYGADYASVRQVGWEVERTIREGCIDMLSAATSDGMLVSESTS